MKNVRFIFVLLLLINCTTDSAEVDETSETFSPQLVTQTCVDDLPKVRLTNNGSQDFDFMVYDTDFIVLHNQNVISTSDSGWLELSDNDVLVVASNNTVYGQKIQLNLQACDNVELEIDTNNNLVSVD